MFIIPNTYGTPVRFRNILLCSVSAPESEVTKKGSISRNHLLMVNNVKLMI